MKSKRLEYYQALLSEIDDLVPTGRVTQVVGLTIESRGPVANVGDLCSIKPKNGDPIFAEVVGFRDQSLLLMPLADLTGIGPGSYVTSLNRPLNVGVSDNLLGRILDGLGNPMDDKGALIADEYRPVLGNAVQPLDRMRIKQHLSVGVRTIDGLLTCGKGQRLGIFAGSGVGKSTLLGMMARNTTADINVIGLIGERGREVREFIENDLGEEGLARSVVVVATSDQPALVRLRAAMVATTIAEYFRDLGNDVLFMMDSVTRFAMAQREVGLAVGEPAAMRGYTPSVFSLLPRLLERTGPGKNGTITAFYTVLVDGDDMNEPITDAVRGILDGHIVLSRNLANKNHYPAIDVLSSISRLMSSIISDSHKKSANEIKTILSIYKDSEDLINIGAYQKGSSKEIDLAIEKIDAINEFLMQSTNEHKDFDTIIDEMSKIID